MTARIAILASGGGSNLQAILNHFSALGTTCSGQVVLVASNRSDARALERAHDQGISARHFDHANAAALIALLDEFQIDLVVLAGYLKLIPKEVTERFRGRMVNIHPGPLPQFGGAGMYGIKVHAAVLTAGVAETEVTIHFVDDRYDHGAVIARWPVPVRAGDTPETLAARVLDVEHIVYPRIVDALSAIIVNQRSS